MQRLAALFLGSILLIGGTSHAAGAPVTRRFAAAGFARVDLRGADTVNIRVGPAFSVVATGPADAVATLTAEVAGDTLRIAHRSRAPRATRGPSPVVTVTMPALAGTSLSGSGTITVGPFRSRRFTAAVGGSGDIRLVRVEADEIELSVAGSGDLSAAGRAGRARLSISGSGDLDAGALPAATLAASVAGSGDIVAHATGTAALSIAGSGDIVVRGPARCTVSKRGSGSARCNAA